MSHSLGMSETSAAIGGIGYLPVATLDIVTCLTPFCTTVTQARSNLVLASWLRQCTQAVLWCYCERRQPCSLLLRDWWPTEIGKSTRKWSLIINGMSHEHDEILSWCLILVKCCNLPLVSSLDILHPSNKEALASPSKPGVCVVMGWRPRLWAGRNAQRKKTTNMQKYHGKWEMSDEIRSMQVGGRRLRRLDGDPIGKLRIQV